MLTEGQYVEARTLYGKGLSVARVAARLGLKPGDVSYALRGRGYVMRSRRVAAEISRTTQTCPWCRVALTGFTPDAPHVCGFIRD